MKKLSSTEIRARLAEIDNLQAKHQARDFDAELKDVMLAGGNVDALEGQQLEAERAARRLRVERQALEATLPEVVRSEAEQEVRQIVEACKADIASFDKDLEELIAIEQRRAAVFDRLFDQFQRQDAAKTDAGRLIQERNAAVQGVRPIPDETAKQWLAQLDGGVSIERFPQPAREQMNARLFAAQQAYMTARYAEIMKGTSASR